MEETAYHCTDPPRLGISNGMELFPLAPYSPQTMNRALDALIYSYAKCLCLVLFLVKAASPITKACLFHMKGDVGRAGRGSKK